MASAAVVLSQYGLVNTDAIVAAAALENVDLAIAAAMIQKESGGRNVWGSDGVSTGGAYTKGGAVTKANYLAYRSLVKAGKIGRQGCGPAQCTSAAYQDSADAIGAPNGLGCWDPVTNIRAGLRGLGALIRTYGVQVGAQHYNGSGPAAVAYGKDFLSRYNTWKARLAGVVVPPINSEDDELDANQAQQLQEVHEQLLTLLKPWGGGVSDKDSADASGYNLFQYVLRNNVEVHQLRIQVAALAAKVDALAAT